MGNSKFANSPLADPANQPAADMEELRAFMAVAPAEKIRLLMHAIEFMEKLRPQSATRWQGTAESRNPSPDPPAA